MPALRACDVFPCGERYGWKCCAFLHSKKLSGKAGGENAAGTFRKAFLIRPEGTPLPAEGGFHCPAGAISLFTRLEETNFTQISASAIVLAIFSAFSEREPSSQLTMKSAYFS